MDLTTAALIGISHGTASPDGQAAVQRLIDAVEVSTTARSAPAAAPAAVRLGHVDVQQPDVAATLGALPPSMPAVVVPLLLSAGYHVHVDLRREIEAVADRQVRLAAALGPDDRLVEVLSRRLDEAGASPDDRVVLAVAGSSDVRAVDDCRDMGERLATALGAPVAVGFLSAAEPRLADAIAAVRADGGGRRVVAASYLLAPGYFQDLAAAAGADLLTEPLLTPDDAPKELVDVVLDRFAETVAEAVAEAADAAPGA
ncbi:sirohydrochlorin ferrochelatase [Agromyces cerinus]|uniref:Sirohydrochlorin ferrochelatase n=1 Tax=Agromyces hippuratus TaxID=286438 RepID=A0A852X3J3_9MICO|nr:MULTISPECIES: CbiX/SirB N-terminal domain-containing protein [Agromyces]MBM7829952.1 sirohydrochlorin ferrochelatase [Agromyces cerinus]NYG20595.1 sirohydrochlorin ferrochelatase [Agromyces hippuratus]